MIDQTNKKDYQGPLYARHPELVKRTQNKENYYYWFWIIAMIAFIVPQVFTALGLYEYSRYYEIPYSS